MYGSRVLARRAWAALVLLQFFALSQGCESCDHEDAPPPNIEVLAHPPAPPPATLTFEASLAGGAETLSAARRFLGRQPARLLMPGSPGELVERMVGEDIGLAERVAEDAPLFAVGVDSGWALAVPIRVDDDPAHPLGAGMPLVPGAPEGALWLGAAPAGDHDEAAALAGGVLVLSEDASALRETLPYAAFTLAAAEPDASAGALKVKLAAQVPSELRQMLEALIERTVVDARASIHDEREQHESPPDFGEPEALLNHLARLARAWLAYLPDLGQSEMTLAFDGGLAELTLRADVRDGSPLAARLAETPARSLEELGALPRDTAFAISMRSAPGAESRFSFLEAFTDVAGERLSARERASLDALAAAWDAAAGPETLVAAGGGAEDAWVAASLAAPRGELAESALAAVTSARFTASLLGLLFDCARPPRPRFGAPLCAGAPALAFERSEARTVFGIGRDAASIPAIANPDGARLAAEPDVARAVAPLGDAPVFAAIVFPSRLMPLAGLSGSEPLQQLSRVSALAARPAPIALAIAAEDDQLVLRVIASDRAVEDAMAFAGSLD